MILRLRCKNKRRRRLPAAALTAAALWTGASAAKAPDAVSNALSDTFTPAEAKAGRAVFLGGCAVCHGENLGGETGPALSGDAFKSKWMAQPPGALAAFIQSRMPPASPGGLAEEDYDAVVAYIVSANNAPKD